MLKSLNKYIKDNEFSINILENLININNFLDITILEPNKIVLETERYEKDNAIRIVTLGYRSFDKKIVDIRKN